MTSYIPETVYGVIPGTYGQMGLIPWPKHMTPNPANLRASSGLELTKKAEAYVASALADPAWRGRPIPLTRKAIESEIDRLIELLDVADDDPDLEPDNDDEPYLGWPDRGPSQLAKDVPQDDREADNADLEATALERHGKGFVASGADDAESTHDDEPSLGGTCYGGGGLEYDLELDTADAEPSLAATEAFHQDDAWHVPEDKWNIEDGEQDAGDAPEFDHAEYDQPGFIWGGGSDDSGRAPT